MGVSELFLIAVFVMFLATWAILIYAVIRLLFTLVRYLGPGR